jgi:multiple sugar transport system ATP-binding protein
LADVGKLLQIENLLDRKPGQLSGGQRQRVAMGRAIVRDPQVFLFDEPLSNLDAKLRVQMRSEIRELHQRLATTTVYVTHDQIEAMTMADRIVVMKDGHVSQIGAPLDLYDRPANAFVAGFIGSPAMNLMDGVVRRDGSLTVVADGVALPAPDLPGMNDGRRVTFGIRPEHLALDPAGFAATVAVVEPTGAETHVVLRMGKRDVVAVFRERHGFKPGDVVHLSPVPGMVHIFDADDGLRIG